jgi:hypothetical protein
MSYNLLKPVTLFVTGNTSMAGSLTSDVVEIQNQDNIGVQLHWTGTPAGSFAFQVSSDYREDAEGNVQVAGNWVPLTVSPAISASGSGDDAYVDFNQLSALYMRVVYTRSSGSGTLTGIIVGKGV